MPKMTIGVPATWKGNQCRMRCGAGIPEACAERERRRIQEDVKDVAADVDGFDVGAQDAADNKCQQQQENEAEYPAGEQGIPIFEAVDAPFEAEQEFVVRQFVHRPASGRDKDAAARKIGRRQRAEGSTS